MTILKCLYKLGFLLASCMKRTVAIEIINDLNLREISWTITAAVHCMCKPTSVWCYCWKFGLQISNKYFKLLFHSIVGADAVISIDNPFAVTVPAQHLEGVLICSLCRKALQSTRKIPKSGERILLLFIILLNSAHSWIKSLSRELLGAPVMKV